jgi:hypothetical protein
VCTFCPGLFSREADDDGKNRKLIHHEVSNLAAVPGHLALHSFFPCAVHANNKLVGKVCELIDKKIIDSLGTYCKLLRNVACIGI